MKTILLITIILLSGCERKYTSSEKVDSDGIQYKTTIIENCEYIYLTTSYRRSITHKGNCKNPIHSR